MLILSRRRGQSIMIGDDIEVFVTDIGDDKVRLGVSGPMSLSVRRGERYRLCDLELSCAGAQTERVLSR